jgi:hypothetical protein
VVAEVVVAEVVAEEAEVAEVAEVVVEAEVVVVVEQEAEAELRKNNADPILPHQCLANRWYPNQHPRSEERWKTHRSYCCERGRYPQTTSQPR